MLTLFGRPNSSNVKKVLWTLEELGLDYDNIKLGGAFGGLDDEKYRKLNPNGKVPTLKDGDFTLWESNTIVRYLAAQYGAKSLWINDIKDRAQAEKWMDWTMDTIYVPFQQFLMNAVRLPEKERNEATLERGITAFEKGLEMLELELQKASWLSGKTFGVGDIIAGVFVYYYYAIDLKRNKAFPKVEEWYKRLCARPAYQKTVMTPIT